ncbi:hypothetical protein [Mycobacterium sp.]
MTTCTLWAFYLEPASAELRLIAAIRRTAAELGAPMPCIEPFDRLTR